MSNVEYFNPFPGLRSFEEEEEYLFFGREKQIDELIHKLSKTRFLAVVGASGSGKSSLVKSGLLPSLHSGYLATAGSGWRICTLRPGNDPLGNLSIALSSTEIIGEDEDNHKTPSIIESILRRSDQGIGEAIKQLSDNHNQNILIVVDQFEELFRFSKYEKSESKGTRDSVIFINLLLAVSKFSDKPIYVVFTMRSDFLGDCTEFRGLPEAINDGQYLIPRMTREERKVAITGPIAVGGAEISQSLLTRLLNDVGDNPDQLPILQHALMRTWYYWYHNSKPDNPINLEHYEAIGTMSKALSLHAEEAYTEIGDDKGKEICKKLFKSLTEKRDDGRGIRHPGIINEICELAETNIEELTRIIDIFRMPGRSFLMPPAGTDLTNETVIDISHESLMRVWDRLIIWVQEEIESAELYTRLAQSAELYQEGKTGLWRDPELLMAVNWQTNQNPNEIWAKRYDPSFDRAINFLEYSVAEKNRETKSAEKKRKAARVIRNIISIVIFLLGVVALYYMIDSQKSAERANDLFKEAQDSANAAKAQRTNAQIAARNAIDSAEAAKDQRTIALTNLREANRLKGIANNALIKVKEALSLATEAKRSAIDSANYAREQKRIALRNADSAKNQTVKATKAERDANRLRMLAEAKNIAIKSGQIINDPNKDSLSLQLAILSYGINDFLNGPDENRIIYDALKNQLTKFYLKIYQERKDKKITVSKYDERAIAFFNNSEFITTGDDGFIKKWKLEGNPIKIAEPKLSKYLQGNFSNIVVSPDNNLSIARNTQGEIFAWNYTTGFSSQLFSLDGRCNFIYPIPSNDNDYVIIASFGTGVFLIKLEKSSLKILSRQLISNSLFNTAKATTCCTVNNLTRIFICSGKSITKLSIKRNGNIFEQAEVSNIPIQSNFKENISSVAVSKSGQFMAIGGEKGAIHIFNLVGSNYKYYKTSVGNISAISSLSFSSKDSDSLLVSGSFDHSIHVNLFTETKAEGLILKESNSWIRGLAISPDNRYIVAVGEGGLIQVWPTTLEMLLNEVTRLPKDKLPIDDHINSEALKDELDAPLIKSLENLDPKNIGINKLWRSMKNKFIK